MFKRRKRYKRLKEESECLLQELINLRNELLVADKELQECREKFQSALEDVTKETILLREYETVVTKGYARNENNDLVFITTKYANGELIEVITEDVE